MIYLESKFITLVLTINYKLLRVVILAIIALITIPIIIGIIDKIKISSLELRANGLLEAAELYYLDHLINDQINSLQIFNAPAFNGLEVKGQKPNNGQIIINNDGEVGLVIADDNYCLYKNTVNDKMITSKFTKEFTKEDCLNKTINRIMSSPSKSCVNTKGEKCLGNDIKSANGLSVNVEVSPDVKHTFYVVRSL
ncbi:MAG: hypothetical protein RR847_04100 [Bacilli bacterium]